MLSNDSGVHHYCYIKDFSRLIRSQITKNTQKAVFCKRCFKHYQGSQRKSKLKLHLKDCLPNKPLKIVMPCNRDNETEPAFLKFNNCHHQHKLPITTYCDFESILKKPIVDSRFSQYVTVKEIHEPMSFCVYFAIDNDSLPESIINSLPNEPYLYRGPDAASHFLQYLISMTNLIGDLLDLNIPMLPLSAEENTRFKNATHCESCNSEFTMIISAVKDHCHLTGKFRSVLCAECNFKRQNQKYLPVIIHGS